MNFLRLRSLNQTATQEQQSVNETDEEQYYTPKKASASGGLISGDAVSERASSGSRNSEIDDGDENGSIPASSGHRNSQVGSHTDVKEDDGIIIIPYKEIPDDWTEAPDMLSYQSLDRSFVFPGEQIRILACLASHKPNTEVITPFKVAALMNKNVTGQCLSKKIGKVGDETHTVSQVADSNSDHQDNEDGEKKIESEEDVQTGESLLRMEEHRRQTGRLLQRFKDSHFFARISESYEPLWSVRRAQEVNLNLSEKSSETAESMKKRNTISAVIDRGEFDARASKGVTRGAVQCCSLLNGDIVVLLQVNVGVEIMRDPVLEILQFEKSHERTLTLETEHLQTSPNHDPSGELLNWLLPLKNSSSSRSPVLSSCTSIGSTSKKLPVYGSSGSQLFSFGNFRSYSMSSLPPNATPPETITTSALQPSFDLEEWNQFSFRKFMDGGKRRNERLLSFRGVSLVPERFSVRCGLEGIFTPGRRWRRKIQLIQPIEIHSFSVDCNTDDLLCVHVKNVSPENAPDIVVFIDYITIVFDKASNSGPPIHIPNVSIEAGNGYSLPNLELRRGEEHSFILKPAMTSWKCSNSQRDGNPQTPHLSSGIAASTWYPSSNIEGRHGGPPSDRYAVLVSCHCNYTESKLFFKQPISWQPHIPKDLMISVATETPKQTLESKRAPLFLQVLTLQASNMTSDDLTLTFLAPTSSHASPGMSVNNSLSSPSSLCAASTDLAERMNSDRQEAVEHGLSSVSMNQGEDKEDGPQPASVNERPLCKSDVDPMSDQGCTHLWLQSRLPIGCIPSQSTATIKLEVLPLRSGIITLDSLQIDVKEKGFSNCLTPLTRCFFCSYESHTGIHMLRSAPDLEACTQYELWLNATPTALGSVE